MIIVIEYFVSFFCHASGLLDNSIRNLVISVTDMSLILYRLQAYAYYGIL